MLIAIALIGSVIVMAERITLLHGLPLWFDETWTAVIATQNSWHGFWKEAWLDCNAPLYYIIMLGWTKVAGVSDWALRIPSLLFTLLAALTPLFIRIPTLRPPERITWSASIFFWWPATLFGLDARCYALLLWMATFQCVYFIKLADEISIKNLSKWSFVSSLTLMTHYYAGFLIAMQFFVIFAYNPKQIFKSSIALLIFAPASAWLLYHLPRLLLYSDPRYSWYSEMQWDDFLKFLSFPFGPPNIIFIILIISFLAVLLLSSVLSNIPLFTFYDKRAPIRLAIISGILTLCVIFLFNIIKPSITERYLTIVTPTMLLALVILASRTGRPAISYILITIFFLTPSLTMPSFRTVLAGRTNYGIEEVSNFLTPYHPDRVIFFWDHPNGQILDKRSLAQVGGFYLNRSHLYPSVVPLVVPTGHNANTRIAELADTNRPAFIWLFESQVKATAAQYPPIFDTVPGWKCRTAVKNYIVQMNGNPISNPTGSVACVKLSNSG